MSMRSNSYVIRFINQFKTLFKELTISETNAIGKVFRNGYCYYFAIMLKDAFNRGEVCMTYDHKHVVWMDDDNVAYDIDGMFGWFPETANKDNYWNGLFIPVEKLPNYIKSFKHIPDMPGTDKVGMEEFYKVRKDVNNRKKDFVNVKIWSFDDPLNPNRYSNVDEFIEMILDYGDTYTVKKGHRSVEEYKVLNAPDMWVYALRYDPDTRTFYGNLHMPDTPFGNALKEAYQKNPNQIRIYPVIFGTSSDGIYFHAYEFITFAYEIIKPKETKDEETNAYDKFIQEISEEPIAEMRDIKEGLFNKEENK